MAPPIITNYYDALTQYRRLDKDRSGDVEKNEVPPGIRAADENNNGLIEFYEYLSSPQVSRNFQFVPREAIELKKELKAAPYGWTDIKIDQLIQHLVTAVGKKWWYTRQAFEAVLHFIKVGINNPEELGKLIDSCIKASGSEWLYSWESLKALPGLISSKTHSAETIKFIVKKVLSADKKSRLSGYNFSLFSAVANPSMDGEQIKTALNLITSLRWKRFNNLDERLNKFSHSDKIEILRNRIGNRPDRRPLAIVTFVRPDADWNNAFDYEHDIFRSLIANGYRVMYYEVSSDEELFTSIEDATRDQKADALIIGGHGKQGQIALGKGYGDKDVLDLKDEKKIEARRLADRFNRGGRVILVSCSTGLGREKEENVANMLKRSLAIRVHANTQPGALKKILFRNRRIVGVEYYGGHYMAISALTNLSQGRELFRLNKLSEAKKYFDRAAKLEPNSSLVHFALGMVNSRLGRYEDAQKNFNRAVYLNPESPLLYTCRAQIRLLLLNIEGKTEDSLTAEKLRRQGEVELQITDFPNAKDFPLEDMLALELKSLLDMSWIVKEDWFDANRQESVKKLAWLAGRFRVLVEGKDEELKDDQEIRAMLLRNRINFISHDLLKRIELSVGKLRANLAFLFKLQACLEKDTGKKMRLLDEAKGAYEKLAQGSKDITLLENAKIALFEINLTRANILLKQGNQFEALRIFRAIDLSILDRVEKLPEVEKKRTYWSFYLSALPEAILELSKIENNEKGYERAVSLAQVIIDQLRKGQLKDQGTERNTMIIRSMLEGIFLSMGGEEIQINKPLDDTDVFLLTMLERLVNGTSVEEARKMYPFASEKYNEKKGFEMRAAFIDFVKSKWDPSDNEKLQPLYRLYKNIFLFGWGMANLKDNNYETAIEKFYWIIESKEDAVTRFIKYIALADAHRDYGYQEDDKSEKELDQRRIDQLFKTAREFYAKAFTVIDSARDQILRNNLDLVIKSYLNSAGLDYFFGDYDNAGKKYKAGLSFINGIKEERDRNLYSSRAYLGLAKIGKKRREVGFEGNLLAAKSYLLKVKDPPSELRSEINRNMQASPRLLGPTLTLENSYFNKDKSRVENRARIGLDWPVDKRGIFSFTFADQLDGAEAKPQGITLANTPYAGLRLDLAYFTLESAFALVTSLLTELKSPLLLLRSPDVRIDAALNTKHFKTEFSTEQYYREKNQILNSYRAQALFKFFGFGLGAGYDHFYYPFKAQLARRDLIKGMLSYEYEFVDYVKLFASLAMPLYEYRGEEEIKHQGPHVQYPLEAGGGITLKTSLGILFLEFYYRNLGNFNWYLQFNSGLRIRF